MMSKSDFYIDTNIRVSHLKDLLEAEAESRLRELAEGHKDMVGANVTLEELSHSETPHAYQARVTAFIRPDDIVAVETAESPEAALDGALGALERQVRQQRDKLRHPWEQSNTRVRMDNIFDLTPRELFDSYYMNLTPEEVSDLDRDAIATELMTKEGLSQQAAYYAADQILVHVQDRADVQ
jgi:ribosome-associated translation inhibitor RaiA